jgi:PTH1 family peptidyl-tRNA hydrolase
MKVVVGLGNPGRKYHSTRHNVGFEVLEELSQRHQASKPKSDFEAEIAEIRLNEEKVLLVFPQTYMNLSGRTVGRLVKFYQLPVEDVLVVCDDLNLPLGRLRLRGSGSAGGQKGLHHIVQCLGTQDVSRLRIGIGRPPGQMDPADYVLGRFSTKDREVIDLAASAAATAVEKWVALGVQAAMNEINGQQGE